MGGSLCSTSGMAGGKDGSVHKPGPHTHLYTSFSYFGGRGDAVAVEDLLDSCCWFCSKVLDTSAGGDVGRLAPGLVSGASVGGINKASPG